MRNLTSLVSVKADAMVDANIIRLALPSFKPNKNSLLNLKYGGERARQI